MKQVWLVNGEKWIIDASEVEAYREAYPDMEFVEDLEKENGSTGDPTVGQDVMGSQSVVGSSGSRETSWLKGEEGWIPDELQPNVSRPDITYTNIYDDVEGYGEVDRDDLIDTYKNMYHKHGFEIKRDAEGIQINAPNGEDLVIPYKGVGGINWGKTKGFGLFDPFSGTVRPKEQQKIVRDFVNQNQDPEATKEKKINQNHYENFVQEKFGPVLNQVTDEEDLISYIGEGSGLTPFNAFTKTEEWHDIKTEMQKRLVEMYGKEQGIKLSDIPGLQFGDPLDYTVSEYGQEEAFGNVEANFKQKEIEKELKRVTEKIK